jgi:hypothetical protein
VTAKRSVSGALIEFKELSLVWSYFKGTVQRKLTRVERGIIGKVFLSQ